jgi:hypothetical protein
MQWIIAQEGSESAARVIERSLALSRNITASWDDLWTTILQSPNDLSLWTAIVRFSLTIAVLALVYYAVSQADEIFKTQSFSKIVEMFVTPLVVIVLLGGNGYILANIILGIRGVGRSLITSVLQLQLGGLSMQQAIAQVINNQLAVQRIRQIFQECATLTGEPLTQCIESKQAEAQAIVAALGQTGSVQAAQGLIDAIQNNAGELIQEVFVQIIQATSIAIIQVVLMAIQWAYVNIAEAALLLSALFAPIAVALLLIPLAGNALMIWFCGFVAILGIQLGYVLLVGFVASILVMADAQNQTAISAAGDYGFLIFVAIFAPFVATMIGKGGGEQLYHGISQRAVRLAQAGVQVIAEGVKFGLSKGSR